MEDPAAGAGAGEERKGNMKHWTDEERLEKTAWNPYVPGYERQRIQDSYRVRLRVRAVGSESVLVDTGWMLGRDARKGEKRIQKAVDEHRAIQKLRAAG